MEAKRETEGDYDMMCVGDVRARNSTAEALPFKQENEGSNPSEPTKEDPLDELTRLAQEMGMYDEIVLTPEAFEKVVEIGRASCRERV